MGYVVMKTFLVEEDVMLLLGVSCRRDRAWGADLVVLLKKFGGLSCCLRVLRLQFDDTSILHSEMNLAWSRHSAELRYDFSPLLKTGRS